MDTNVKVIWSTEEIEYFMNLNESVTLQPATVSWILVLEIIDDLSSAGASLTDETRICCFVKLSFQMVTNIS